MQSRKRTIAIDEVLSPRNVFSTLFAESLSASGWNVVKLSWTFARLRAFDLVILHWPEEFFGRGGRRPALRKLLKMVLVRTFFGVRFVWVTHDIRAHDHSGPRWLSILFVRQLDGLIHLSSRVRADVRRLYHPRRSLAELVTVHGLYPGETEATAWRKIETGRPIALLNFGQLRVYKNLEGLAAVVADVTAPAFRLQITGLTIDRPMVERLVEKARSVAHLHVDPHESPLSEAALEALVDGSDAVVLAYTSISNSGAIMFALSRNRPVLAPRQGALQEVQDVVGSEWVYLYDGDLTGEVLFGFLEWLEVPRGGRPDLSAYEWRRVRSDLRSFLQQSYLL